MAGGELRRYRRDGCGLRVTFDRTFAVAYRFCQYSGLRWWLVDIAASPTNLLVVRYRHSLLMKNIPWLAQKRESLAALAQSMFISRLAVPVFTGIQHRAPGAAAGRRRRGRRHFDRPCQRAAGAGDLPALVRNPEPCGARADMSLSFRC